MRRPQKNRWFQWTGSLLLLGILGIMPLASGIAGTPPGYEWHVVGYVALISLVTYLIYWRDKRRARDGMWRTPESTLHFLELVGGWPAAFLAQRILRHKIMKKSYQIVFWCIIIFHQALAYDSFLGWRWVRLGYAWLELLGKSR